MPRLLLVLLVLLVALSAAAAEVPLSDLTYVPGSTDYSREDVEVVGGSDGFLVVWEEYLFDAYISGTHVRAYDADGTPLRPEWTVAGSLRGKAVWTGEEYLVVGGTDTGRFRRFYFPSPAIYVTRLRRDGTVIERLGHIEQLDMGSVRSVAWNGTNVLALVVVGGQPRLLLLDRQGKFVSETPADADIVAVAPKGDSFFFLRGGARRAIREGNGRYAVVETDSIAILDADGNLVDRVPVAGARTLSWDGSAWHTAYVDEQGRVCTAVFTSSANVRRDCRVIAGAEDPAVGAIPRRTLLAWESGHQVATDAGIASMTFTRQFASASTVDATGLLVAWLERGIQLGGLRHDGTRRVQFFIPDTRAERVQLAANGDLSLIVWRAAGELFAMRLEANGAPLHPILPLGTGSYAPVVPNGDGWLVLRHDGAMHAVATTISRDAVITGEHVVGTDPNSAEVAAAGDGFLVATFSALQRIDRNGVPVGAAIAFPGGYDRRIACSAQACLIVTQGLVTLVGHEGRTLRGPEPLQLPGTLGDVTALADGTFRVYTTEAIGMFAADGTPRGTMRWNSEYADWGGVELFNGRPIFFFTRDGRAYLRDLPPRSRAVRP